MELSRLPKWAQKEFEDLQRQRDVAVRALNEFLDTNTPSAFSYDEYVCTGERGRGPTPKRHYIQTHKMDVVFAGVELRILNRLDGDGIELSWGRPGRGLGDVAMIPTSYQSVVLKVAENMR